MKKRIQYVMAFIVLLLIEVIIVLFVHDRFIRPYIGDALVVIVLYCFIRIFIQDRIKLLPVYIFIFAVIIELLQFFNIAGLLGLGGNALARVIIGTSFDWKDIICFINTCQWLIISQDAQSLIIQRNLQLTDVSTMMLQFLPGVCKNISLRNICPFQVSHINKIYS